MVEGVGSADDSDELSKLHWDHAQGYFFAKPLPAGDVQSSLEDQN